MGVRLPSAYQEVEYLESTGTQYLVAPWDGTPNIVHAKGRFMYVNLTTVGQDWDTIFGVPNLQLGYSNTDKFRLLNNSYRYGYVEFTNISALTIYDFEAYQSGSELSVTLNGERKTGTTTQTTFVESNLYIFAMRVGYGYGDMRIYNLKAYSTIDDSNLIRDFVPCYRKADNKPGMYDLVTGEFFVNQGEGEFIVGPDVIDSISPLMVAWRMGLIEAANNWNDNYYIQDGLVLWLDGLDRGGVAGQWIDKISGNICTLSGAYTEQNDSIYFSGGLGEFDSYVDVLKDSGTVEAVVRRIAADSSSKPILTMHDDRLGASIYRHQSDEISRMRYYCHSGSLSSWLFPISTANYTISGSSDIGIANGIEGQLNTDTSWVSKGKLLAARGTGTAFIGEICSVRVYNRKLSKKEILHNQKIDNKLYNLGITF